MSSAKWRLFCLGLNVLSNLLYLLKRLQLSNLGLTHWDWDTVATILQMFQCIFVNKNYYILMQILLEFVPKGPIDKKWTNP